MDIEEFAQVERAIEAVRNGEMVVMVDDEDRENEGDLVIAAEHCHAEQVNFMCREGRGLICVALTSERVDALGLPMMVPTAPGNMGTAFTVSIEAVEGVTTGISAADRARTILVASDDGYGSKDIASPGHVFPLRAQDGGVLVRSGHTEGSVDLARLAGCRPAAVICEIMREDGEMARMQDLRGFAERHDLLVVSIAALIRYRVQRESLVEQLACEPFASGMLGISLEQGWQVRRFRSRAQLEAEFLVLQKGEFAPDDEEPVLLRAQRSQVLGDVFGYWKDDSASRLHAAIKRIEAAGRGLVLYILGSHLGGTADELGAPGDRVSPGLRPKETGFRDFGLGAQVLKDIGIRRIQVLTNNPRKIVGLGGYGIDVVGTMPLEVD